jgi:two-component system cell cycle sensor histidine kinase/response regulator CckA
MEQTHPQPATYARALRIVAGTIALVIIGKHITTDVPSPIAQHDLLVVRGIAVSVAIGVALLSPSHPSMAWLRSLAFALGIDVVFATIGVTTVLPLEVWEQSVSLVAMMFAAAVFMPWSWRWQAAFVAIALLAATLVFWLVIPRSALDGHTTVRVLLTLYIMAALTVVGADLADRARRQIETAQSDQRANEQQRLGEQRLDALGRFAGGMAHQFNNLLGGILTHVSVLRQDVTLGRAATDLDEIAAAARQGRDLTNELLRFTRNEPTQLRPTDVRQVLDGVARLAEAMLTDVAAVQSGVPEGLPPVAADPDQLAHACTQVVLNARDAMQGRPGGRLTLSAVLEGTSVRLSISDTGRGMGDEERERAFEPFFSTKPMHQAKGLGLATVHRVMREHRGAVRIESTPGRGTTVHLLLPVSAQPVPAPPPPPAPAPLPPPHAAVPVPTGAGAATILVVDDEPIVRNSLRRALTRFGYRVLEAGDGASALAAMQGAVPPVDLVILDLVLPGGGAGIFELLKAVRPDVKVLVSSGFSPDAEAARGLANRADGFLPKPYELAQLRETVKDVLGRS